MMHKFIIFKIATNENLTFLQRDHNPLQEIFWSIYRSKYILAQLCYLIYCIQWPTKKLVFVLGF